jgi:hypothetical protein
MRAYLWYRYSLTVNQVILATVKLVIDLKDKEIVHTHIYNISGSKFKSLMSKKTKPKQNNQNRQRLPMAEEFANELMSRDVIFGEIEYRRCKRG